MDKIAIGTRIRFVRNLYESASEDHPAYVFANKGEEGEITGHNAWEGYMVKRDVWPASFGAMIGIDFEVINTP